MTSAKMRCLAGAFGVIAAALLFAAVPTYLACGTALRLDRTVAFGDCVARNNISLLAASTVNTIRPGASQPEEMTRGNYE